MLLVDNAAYSFAFQLENAVPILPFYDDKNDEQLLHLLEFFNEIHDKKDMREECRKHF